MRVAATVVVIAVVALAVGFLVIDTEAPAGRSGAIPNSIAVLPLENLSPDAVNAYYAAGLHEEILNQLSKLRSLNIISRTSVLRYAQNRPPIPDIARELNVETILEGSVSFADGRIRVAMQLIEAASDRQIWSEIYDGDISDVFDVQADIATNVAKAMSLVFSPLEERRDLLELPAGSSDTYAPRFVEVFERAPGD
jgi:TolB-like protein